LRNSVFRPSLLGPSRRSAIQFSERASRATLSWLPRLPERSGVLLFSPLLSTIFFPAALASSFPKGAPPRREAESTRGEENVNALFRGAVAFHRTCCFRLCLNGLGRGASGDVGPSWRCRASNGSES